MASVSWPSSVAELIASYAKIRLLNLRAWINFNNSSSPSTDYSGNGNNATLNGTTNATGISGNGRNFTTTTDYMTIN